jgi:hypothetical protein
MGGDRDAIEYEWFPDPHYQRAMSPDALRWVTDFMIRTDDDIHRTVGESQSQPPFVS